MPYDPNQSDIRSVRMRDPSFIRTFTYSELTGLDPMVYYLMNQDTIRPNPLILTDGVLIKNMSGFGIDAGFGDILEIDIKYPGDPLTIGSNRILLLPTREIFLKVNDLSNIVYRSVVISGSIQTFISVVAS